MAKRKTKAAAKKKVSGMPSTTNTRSAVLVWNSLRDKALVSAMRVHADEGDVVNVSDIVDSLTDDDAFIDLDNSAVNAQKVTRRAAALREAGVSLPTFSRARYSPDVDSLNEL